MPVIPAENEKGDDERHHCDEPTNREWRIGWALPRPVAQTEDKETRVYYNTHKPGYFSVLTSFEDDRGKHRYLVIAYARIVILINVRFWVSPAQNETARREKKKSVHVWAKGRIIFASEKERFLLSIDMLKDLRRGTYDYEKHTTFVDAKTGEPIHGSPLVVLIHNTMFYLPEAKPAYR